MAVFCDIIILIISYVNLKPHSKRTVTLMEIFINSAIHNGIQNYLNEVENIEVDKIHVFEFWVIKILVRIYDEINIVNPFKLGNIDSFKQNLAMYGLKDTEIDLFFKYMAEYDQWLNSATLVPKTELPTKIQGLLMNMILLKNSVQKLAPEEIEYFDDFFDPTTGDMVKIQNLIVADRALIPKNWRRKKLALEGGLIFEEVKPDLLPASDYKRFGLSINEVKQLSNLKITEINDKIKAEDAANEAGGRTKFDPKKLILTSGSGFVDTIVLLSIIATEVMIGLLIAFAFIK